MDKECGKGETGSKFLLPVSRVGEVMRAECALDVMNLREIFLKLVGKPIDVCIFECYNNYNFTYITTSKEETECHVI